MQNVSPGQAQGAQSEETHTLFQEAKAMQVNRTDQDAGREHGAMNKKPLPMVSLSESHCKGDEGVIAWQGKSNPMERVE